MYPLSSQRQCVAVYNVVLYAAITFSMALVIGGLQWVA